MNLKRKLPFLLRLCLLSVRQRLRDRVHAYHKFQLEDLAKLDLQLNSITITYQHQTQLLANARAANTFLQEMNHKLLEELDGMKEAAKEIKE